jgi:hypothetical protein
MGTAMDSEEHKAFERGETVGEAMYTAQEQGDEVTEGAEPMARRIGVLFVHGMGVQRQGDTLRDFGDPLLNWADAWLKGHDGTASLTECHCPDSITAPRHQHAEWRPRGAQQAVDLVLAESWWAKKFPPPSASQLSPWLPALIWSVVWRALAWLAVVIFVVVLAANRIDGVPWHFAVVPAFVIGLMITTTVFLIPPALLALSWIPYVQKYAMSAMAFLLQWVGDALIYEQRPMETYAAEQQIQADLNWLRDQPWVGTPGADGIVIGAHSLGSLLAADLLARIKNPCPTSLVTFGSAIRLLKRRTRRYAGELESAQPELVWLNFYDPFDLISGAVGNAHRHAGSSGSFPYNFKIDNCRSVLTSHGSYQDNAEQFLPAFYRLILNTAALSPTIVRSSGDELKKAIRARSWRSRASSLLVGLSLPGGMAAALILFRIGWPAWLSDQSVHNGLLSQGVKDLLGTGAHNPAAAMVVAMMSGAAGVLAYLWIAQLILRRLEALSVDALTAGSHGKKRREHWRGWIPIGGLILLPLVAVAAALLLSTPSQSDNLNAETALTAIALSFIPAVVFELWTIFARKLRQRPFTKEDKLSPRSSPVADVIGEEFTFLQYPNQRGWARYFPGRKSWRSSRKEPTAS